MKLGFKSKTPKKKKGFKFAKSKGEIRFSSFPIKMYNGQWYWLETYVHDTSTGINHDLWDWTNNRT